MKWNVCIMLHSYRRFSCFINGFEMGHVILSICSIVYLYISINFWVACGHLYVCSDVMRQQGGDNVVFICSIHSHKVRVIQFEGFQRKNMCWAWHIWPTCGSSKGQDASVKTESWFNHVSWKRWSKYCVVWACEQVL